MSYSEPPPPPPYYGAPAPVPGGPQPQTSGMAIAALVLGIVGMLMCCFFVPSVLGIVFGTIGMRDVRESGGAKTGEGLAKAGFILGIIGTALGVLYWAWVIGSNFLPGPIGDG